MIFQPFNLLSNAPVFDNVAFPLTIHRDKPWVAKLGRSFQPPEVRRFVESTFAGSMVPAFR